MAERESLKVNKKYKEYEREEMRKTDKERLARQKESERQRETMRKRKRERRRGIAKE